MKKIEKAVKDLEKSLDHSLLEILRGILPIDALKRLKGRGLSIELGAICENPNHTSLPNTTEKVEYTVRIDQLNDGLSWVYVGNIWLYFKKKNNEFTFVSLDYDLYDIGGGNYNANSSLKELKR